MLALHRAFPLPSFKLLIQCTWSDDGGSHFKNHVMVFSLFIRMLVVVACHFLALDKAGRGTLDDELISKHLSRV